MAILREFFLLLELRDRIAATAEKYQKKLIRRFQDAKEKKQLRGASTNAIKKELDKEQYHDAAKAMVEYFAKNDPTKNNKYLDWVVRQWLKEKLLWEDAFKMVNLLNDFEKYRKKLDKKDLNQYDSYRDVEEALESHRGTEVAGVRVQNFLKKDDIQRYRKSMVADPSAPKHHEAYNTLLDDSELNDDNYMPRWFEDEVYSNASAHAEDLINWEDFLEDGYDQLDRSDYEDEDGEFDEARYEEDARDQAAIDYEAAKEAYIESHVQNHGEEEWTEHVRVQQKEAQDVLDGSHHMVPELEVIYENDRMTVMIPNSKDAACLIGKGTEWCTAAEVSDNAWWEYAKESPLYAVITDKIGKFQFHFESDQYMDVHDRYIEDSKALIQLTHQYSQEMGEAFADLATKWEQWWMLPVDKTPDDFWGKMLQASDASHVGLVRDAVRQYQAHSLHAPEGWAADVRMNLLTGSNGGEAIRNGWAGALKPEEAEEIITQHGIHDALSMAQHLRDEGTEISKGAWEQLIQKNPEVLFYTPVEMLDRQLLDDALEYSEITSHKNQNTRKGRASSGSFLTDFYSHFQFLRGEEEGSIKHQADFDPTSLNSTVEAVKPTEEWVITAMERGRKVAGMITMDDIIKDVLGKPQTLMHYNMDLGIKPWLALAQKAMSDSNYVGVFVKVASDVIARNRSEPWTKDITNLVHQITTHNPILARGNYGDYPTGDMPLDTQNAILDRVAGHEDTPENSKQDFAHSIQQTIDNTGDESPRLDPLSREALFRYRQGGEDADEIRSRVPAQHQLDV